MNTTSRFIAWRYLRATYNEKNISTMVHICFIGILIGSFSLALVSAVMHGFETTIHEKMQSIHAQIIIRAYGQELDSMAIAQVLKNEFPEVIAYSPSSQQYVIVQSDNQDYSPIVAGIKGINPCLESHTSTLEKKILFPHDSAKKLETILSDNQILIGDKFAQDLTLSIGDEIELLYTDYQNTHNRKINLEKTTAIVGGTFKTGIDEFDSSMIFCNLEFLQSFFDEGVTQINVKLAPHTNEQATIEKLKKRLGIEVYSWQELYPALVSALKLEKYVMFFILALITLVASMNIISLLFMQITQKRPDIAILKAMGTSNSQISHIFMFMGMLITTVSTGIGLALAAFVCWLLNTYPFIELPDAYYVSHLPAHLAWHIICTVFVVVFTLGCIATWIPTRKTKYINISQILRFEG